MFHKFSKGKAIAVGGDGDGWTIASPFYWYRHTTDWHINSGLNTSGSPENYERSIYFRVKLKGGVEYALGTYGEFDGKCWLYNESGTELTYNDDGSCDVNGEYYSDCIWYTPSADGIFIFRAGAYSDGQGDMTVCCYPAPEQEEIPNATMVYETSSGFNALGLPIKYRNADSAEIAFKTHPKKNLVLRYDFKSLIAETGQVFSQSGGGNVQFTTINGVQCAKFDGTSSLVTWDNTDVTEILDTNETTISIWFLPTLSTPLGCRILGRTSDATNNTCFYQINLSANWGSPMINAKLGWNYGTSPYYDFRYPHNWIHLCVVQKSDGTYKLYIDGKEYGNDSNHGWTSKDAPLFIGSSHSSSYYFNGYMANLRIYNRALSLKEIAILGKEVRDPELYIPDGTPAYFDGNTSAKLICQDLPIGTNPTSISVRFCQKSGDGLQTICGYGNNDTNAQKFIMTNFPYMYGHGWYSDAPYEQKEIVYNKWYHTVFVYENGIEKCYLDGELLGQRSFSFNTVTSGFEFRIGTQNDDRYFIGNIKDVNVYNRALSANEVTALYNKQEITDGRVLNVPLAKGMDNESIFSSKNFIYAEV